MAKYKRTGVVLNNEDKIFCDRNNLSPTEILRNALRSMRMNEEALRRVEHLNNEILDWAAKVEKLSLKYGIALDFIAQKGFASEFSDKVTK